jgi:signal transduction histidine kinase
MLKTMQYRRRNKELADINLKLNSEIKDRHRAEKEVQKLNRNLEKKIKERTSELENLNQELESFAYSISHDLRSPLRSMQGFSSAILEDFENKLDEKGKDYLKRIVNASEHMGQLIDALLKLSRVTRHNLKKEKINLSNIANKIASDLRSHDPKRKIKIIIEPNMNVNGDPNLIYLALENLFNNAWKFTSKNPNGIIEFNQKEENNHIVFCLKDNGVGFEMEFADKLFQPFKRHHKDFEGTGIGLATVDRIIKRHGGRIWADGKVDEGATFYFSL